MPNNGNQHKRPVPIDWDQIDLIQQAIVHYYSQAVKISKEGAVTSRNHWRYVSRALYDHFNVIVDPYYLKKKNVVRFCLVLLLLVEACSLLMLVPCSLLKLVPCSLFLVPCSLLMFVPCSLFHLQYFFSLPSLRSQKKKKNRGGFAIKRK